ncbi:MAG: alpha/beta fold hydrolase [Deltaproteobacteria bacterium]|nr:alpha/beta fold hydrolase [Candidatus Zymogenaceae bacterium]
MGDAQRGRTPILYAAILLFSIFIFGVWGCAHVGVNTSETAGEYTGMEGEYVLVQDMNIHTYASGVGCGERIPVVFIHGFAASFYCWRFNVEPLAVDGPVYAMDLPGFGLSDKPKGHDYSLDGYADFIAAYMDAMGIERAVLVGNSMGGGIAVKTQIRHPDRVAGLVLIDALGYFNNEFYLYRALGTYPLGEILLSCNNRLIMKTILKTKVYRDNAYVTKDVVDSFMAVNKTENGRRSPVWVLRAMGTYPVIPTEEIKSVSAPTLIIWGEKDRVLPVSHAELFSRDIEHTETVIFPDVGHMPMEERSGEVNDLIGAFIEDLL